MDEAQDVRTRWNPEELKKVAAQMVVLQTANPKLGDLDAVREAQSVLKEDRQREIKQWTAVKRLDPFLAQFRAEPPQAPAGASALNEASNPGSGAGVDAAAQAAAQPLVQEIRQVIVSEVDPAMTEAAFIAALESPAVEKTLVALFSRALEQAVANNKAGIPAPKKEEVQAAQLPAEFKVLLAGFEGNEQKQLQAALGDAYETRTWKANQGTPMFKTLSKICSVAVIPDSMPEEMDEELKSLNMQVVRHSGSANRLVERLAELA